jgi:hypothetical protein
MSFELNLSIIPNRIYYLEGVQLSYIKVYAHIFNLWYSNKPCFIGIDEFVERTGLAKSTIYESLLYFEKMNEIKRVRKGGKKYILQPSRFIETEGLPVDKPRVNRSKNNLNSEIADRNSELAEKNSAKSDHNNKYNNKYKKSFCASPKSKKPKTVENHKADNEKKHDFAPMMNEKASIKRNEAYKRCKPPEELKNLVKISKGRARINYKCQTNTNMAGKNKIEPRPHNEL